MYEVVGIKFESGNRIYYFSNNNLPLEKGNQVIVETEKGQQFGTVKTSIIKMDESKLFLPLKNVLRIATEKDLKKQSENQRQSSLALEDAKKIANKLELPMSFIDASYTFDKNQLIFSFVADVRIDFRELAKKLAAIYKTRIELKQIGVRDKAKEIGGLGPCGRFLCCNTFLNDFSSVSINMAKNQYIALNPTKINGICGRLLCCLNYEDATYKELKKDFPPLGTFVTIDKVKGRVISHNILKRTYVVEKNDRTTMEVMINESN